MLDHLLSKLSVSDAEGQQHPSRAAGRHRFQTDVNSKPERSSGLGTPRISPEVSYFLSMHGESVEELLKLPAVVVPEYDDSLPLTSYFVSTSHNTYLLGDQLWGKASSASYTHVIFNGAHCVEIDVWPGNDPASGPIVTHGWTLTQDIMFKDVCIAINAAVETKEDDWPLFVSLECHVEVAGQKELVGIMKEAWGDKLVASAIHGVDGNNVSPKELKNRILMMIEYYAPEGTSTNKDSSQTSLEENGPDSSARKPKISAELSELGIYAHSVKPKKNWLKQEIEELHVLINLSESALAALLPHALTDLIAHGQRHLRRVYPRGTRIMSGNLNPLVSWRAGSHFAALNWQDFDLGMQLNEAMFADSAGWVPKPPSLLGGPKEEGRLGLSLDIIGLSSLSHPDGKQDFRVRVRVYLYHETGEKEWKSKSVKCRSATDTGADAMFNENCVWAFDADDLAFLRIVVIEDDEPLAIFCTRVQHIQQGYRFVRLLDKKGKDTHSTLLVNFIISNINKNC